jgi:hypothetical protein
VLLSFIVMIVSMMIGRVHLVDNVWMMSGRWRCRLSRCILPSHYPVLPEHVSAKINIARKLQRLVLSMVDRLFLFAQFVMIQRITTGENLRWIDLITNNGLVAGCRWHLIARLCILIP